MKTNITEEDYIIFKYFMTGFVMLCAGSIIFASYKIFL